MTHTAFVMLIMFAVYLSFVLAISYVGSRSTQNLSDYILAGRNLSGTIVAFGAGASDMSSWLLMALPGAVFVNGLNQIWLPIGLIIGAYFNWRFVAPKLRIYTEVSNNALTLPAYFAGRFPHYAKRLRASTALVVLIFFICYTSAGFVAGAYLAQLLFPVTYHEGLLIVAGVIIAYTTIGGFMAISWLDFFQGTLMFFSLLIVPTLAFHHLNTWETALPPLYENVQHYFNPFNAFSLMGFVSLMAWGLGYFGQPHILVRFMAARSHKEMPLARFICMLWMSIALFGAVATGIVGKAYFQHGMPGNPEEVFIRLAISLVNPWLAGLLVAAVLSAIMNTSSAQLLSSASALIEDAYHPFIHPQASAKELMWGARLAVLVVAIIALALASNPKGNILQLVSYAWAGLGASFGPVILTSLFWKKITGRAAIIGMFSAAITVIVWEMLGKHMGGIFNLYSMIPAFAINLLCIYGLSKRATPDEKTLEQFEKVNNLLDAK